MGYTHYWRRPKNLGSHQFAHFASLASKVIDTAEEQGIELSVMTCHDASVRVNGVGEDSHEMFVFDSNMITPDWMTPSSYHPKVNTPLYFDFCKTARKPYDPVVTALLLLVHVVWGDLIQISSDGMPREWQDGYELLEEAMRDREDVDVPRPMDVLTD